MWDRGAEEQLSFTEIRDRLRLPAEDVTRVLHSLSGTKHRILLKVGDGKGITPRDSFRINVGFKAPARRIKACHPSINASFFMGHCAVWPLRLLLSLSF